MPKVNQSLISDIFKKISEVTLLTTSSSYTHQPSTQQSSTQQSSTQTSSTQPSSTSPPSIRITANNHAKTRVQRPRSVRLKPRSIRTLRSTTTKPKQKQLNPYKKKRAIPRTHQQTLNSNRASDFTWIGKKMTYKHSNSVRIWSQNYNGINRRNHFKNFAEELISINSVESQIIALTETNLNSHNTYVTDQLTSVFEEISPGAQFTISSTNNSHSSETLQFGGALTLSQGHMAMRIAKKGYDKFGRYHWTQYYGKKNHLKIYNFYRPVVHTDNSAGDGTVWAQHRELLLAKGINADPRQHILDTLLLDVKDDQMHNRQVLIVGDFNENVFSKSLNEMFSRVGLVNVIKEQLQSENDYRSYFRGKYIIDGMWASPNVAENVKSLGLAPFYYLIPSDHRAIYVDLDVNALLDDFNPNFVPPPYRRLKSSIPKRVDKYCEQMKDRWFLYNIKEKVDQLEDTLKKKGKSVETTNLMNNIDNQIQEIMRCSEKKCCKIGRHANFSWSAAFGKALKKERHLLCQLKREALKSAFQYTTAKIKLLLSELRAVRKQLKEIKKDDISFRDKHLNECARRALASSSAKNIESIIKQLKHIEKQIREAKRIKRTLKGHRLGALTHVLIPARSEYSQVKDNMNFDHTTMENIWPKVSTKANGRDIVNWETVDQKNKVEELTLACMKKHFAQAQGTPLTSPDWIEKLSSESVQQMIIDGTYDLSDMPKHIQMYLRALERPTTVKKDLPFKYTFKEFCFFIEKSDESTSASPSGRHYGHYKVLRQHLPDVLKDIYRIMNFSIQYGIVLNRYADTVTTLIQKEALPYIHRLRPLHLIEVELQAITKSQWAKQLINYAEKQDLIVDSQYGYRANRQAQSLILNKTLTYDIHRHLAKDYTSVDEDLKACFDRELSHLGAVEDRFYGNSFAHGEFLTKTTTGMKFYVKTSYGISDTHYTYTKENPIWGLGQGIGWSGARWTLTSSTIDRCMQNECRGFRLSSPDQTVQMNKLLSQFCDDLAQICNDVIDRPLIDQTTHNVQLHTDLVNVTGGRLALDKCKFYHCIFYFDNEGNPHLRTKDQHPSNLEVLDPIDGKLISIEQYDPNKTHLNLGYLLAPTGCQYDMFEKIFNCVKEWSDKVEHSSLWPHEIILSYDSILTPQVRYRMAATSLSFDQCNFMMKFIYPILLHAASLPSTFPRCIASAPSMYAGFQWEHFYDIQGKEKLKFFMLHIKRGDTTGQLMYIALQNMQQSIGCEEPFYEQAFEQYAHLLPDSWLKHLCEYVSSRGIEFELTNSPTFKKQRKFDQFIMDVIKPHFSREQLTRINKVRIHLKVLRMSDVTDIGGKYILPNIRDGTNYRESTYGWMKQPLVEKYLPLWRQACNRLQQALKCRPLGNWINRSQRWKWQSNLSGSVITNNEKTYTRQSINGRYKYILFNKSHSILPYDADVCMKRGYPRLLCVFADKIIPEINSFNPYKSFFENHTLPKQVEKKIVRLIKKRRLIYGSDASVNDKFQGSFAWGILDKSNENNIFVKYNAQVHGDRDQIHSTRGELFGILGCMRHIDYILTKYKPILKKKIPIYTDSKSSIQIAKTPLYLSYKNAFCNDADIKAEVRSMFEKLKGVITLYHVKAHQDEKIVFKNLSTAAKLNSKMDLFAKDALINTPKIKARRMVPHLPKQRISLKTKFDRITTDVASNINRYKVGHECERWLGARWKLTPNQMSDIEWIDIKGILGKTRGLKRTQYAKIIHKHWATNKRQHDWNQVDSPNCPFCKTEVEDRLHIMQCSNEVAKTNRIGLLVELRKKLNRLQTSPLITNHIIRSLHQFHNGYPVPLINVERADHEVEKQNMKLINYQLSFGIDNLLSGALTTHLSLVQKHHIETYNVGKMTSIRAWNRNFIELMLDHANDIWKFRSEVLHEEEKLTREAAMREQAVNLLIRLRQDPHQVTFQFRNLLNRTRHYLRTTHARNVRSWLNRITLAVEMEANRRKRGVNDIRWWIEGRLSKKKENERLWGKIHDLDTDYDSDDTRYENLRFPDEHPYSSTWIEPTVDNNIFTRTVTNNCTTPN